jgi:hypothetical protein
MDRLALAELVRSLCLEGFSVLYSVVSTSWTLIDNCEGQPRIAKGTWASFWVSRA